HLSSAQQTLYRQYQALSCAAPSPSHPAYVYPCAAPSPSHPAYVYPCAAPSPSHPAYVYPCAAPSPSHPAYVYPCAAPSPSHPAYVYPCAAPSPSHPAYVYPSPSPSHPGYVYPCAITQKLGWKQGTLGEIVGPVLSRGSEGPFWLCHQGIYAFASGPLLLSCAGLQGVSPASP
uniref:Uncharacterized protein n=1 Tax=Gopherus agassizii TaxID=38772 RepID=A0A452GKP6_9SAUR